MTAAIASALAPSHHAAVWCAWCGKPVGVEAVVIAKVVTYHPVGAAGVAGGTGEAETDIAMLR